MFVLFNDASPHRKISLKTKIEFWCLYVYWSQCWSSFYFATPTWIRGCTLFISSDLGRGSKGILGVRGYTKEDDYGGMSKKHWVGWSNSYTAPCKISNLKNTSMKLSLFNYQNRFLLSIYIRLRYKSQLLKNTEVNCLLWSYSFHLKGVEVTPPYGLIFPL